MAYPFANNQYAQSSHNDRSYGYDHGYTDPYSQQHHQQYPPHTGEPPETQEYEPSMVARDMGRERSDLDYVSRPIGGASDYDNDAKMLNEGRSPYGMSTDVLANAPYTSPYGGSKGIWTADDKRVMAKRSVPVRIFRVLFCAIVNAIIVIVSIICLVVIFVRPPNVGIGNIVTPSANSVGVSGSTLTINGSIDFIISNPNSISATLANLGANIYDTVDQSQAIGSANIVDKKIDAHSNTTIHFPYQIKYDPKQDSNQAIIKDIATKCGLTGQGSQNLNLVLKVNSRLTILGVPIPIGFSQPINFACPLSPDILKSIGIDNIAGLFGRSLRKRWDDFVADQQQHSEL